MKSWSRRCSPAGCSRFVFMPYAHRAGMSRSLNHWVANVQATFAPHAIGFGTFHPEDDALLPGAGRRSLRAARACAGPSCIPRSGDSGWTIRGWTRCTNAPIEHGALLLIHAGRRPEANEHVGARAFRAIDAPLSAPQGRRRACRRGRVRRVLRPVRPVRRPLSGYRDGVQQISRRSAAPLAGCQLLAPVAGLGRRACRGRRAPGTACRHDGARFGGVDIWRGEPRREAARPPPAARPRRRAGPAGASRAHAVLHLVSLRALGGRVRLRHGRGPRSAVGGRPTARAGCARRLLARAHRRPLPGRRRRRRADRVGARPAR